MPAKTHGMSGTPIYSVWGGIKDRCYNKNCTAYKNYGGRGIEVCEEWKTNFNYFYDWAIAIGYKENLTIDRINVDGNYEPNNCRFITLEENISLANKYNIENSFGAFSEKAKNNSKNALIKLRGKQIILYNIAENYEFDSIGKAAEFIVALTGREHHSVKSHLQLVLKGKTKSIYIFKAKYKD